MTIIARNSLTVSNVNDGTITHTAYAYSADGTDRFTTVYPNLNLLDGTRGFSGTWTNSSSWVTDGTYKGLTVKKRTSQWGGIYKTFTVPKDGAYTFSAYIKSSGNTANIYRYGGLNSTSSNIIQKSMGNNFDWTIDSVTLNLKANDSVWIRYEISGAGTDSILWVAGYKYEPGSTSTPYMPSSTEVTTADYPSYIGQYSDFTATASTDPAKYAPWTIFKGGDGTGIKTTTITYAGSTSGTTAPTSGWTSTVPTVEAGSYLWTKTVWTYTDNTSETGYSVAKMGDTGPTGPAGSNGDPGKIVSDTEPTTRFKGLTWKYSGTTDLTASDGTVIHPNTEYYYNGKNWMINFLSANNIDANSITAEKINGTDLEVKNGKFTDGVIETSWKNGTVAGSTNIEKDHLIITRTDSSVNTTNSIGLDSTQGLIMTYTDNSTGRIISVGTNFQGMFLTDSTGISASISPAGVKLSSDVNWTQIGNIGGRRAEWKRENNRVTMNIHGGNGDGFPIVTSGGTLLGILPTNARPPSDISMPATAQGAGATAQISINSTGEVRCYRWGGDSVYFGAYISYYVE